MKTIKHIFIAILILFMACGCSVKKPEEEYVRGNALVGNPIYLSGRIGQTVLVSTEKLWLAIILSKYTKGNDEGYLQCQIYKKQRESNQWIVVTNGQEKCNYRSPLQIQVVDKKVILRGETLQEAWYITVTPSDRNEITVQAGAIFAPEGEHVIKVGVVNITNISEVDVNKVKWKARRFLTKKEWERELKRDLETILKKHIQ